MIMISASGSLRGKKKGSSRHQLDSDLEIFGGCLLDYKAIQCNDQQQIRNAMKVRLRSCVPMPRAFGITISQGF